MDERILALLKDARRQLEHERELRTAPIAIVGIGCRFPGAGASPAAFWQLLEQGIDATGDVPRDRWDAESLYDQNPEAPGKAYVKRGGFLDHIDGFDPEFFGISPREAVGMDPQQRLLLEVTWEALEDAGVPPDRLKGSATGVWVGSCVDDYARRSVTSGDLTRIDPYSALGNTRSIAAGRIAYVLDLRGPVVQLDTACSSSLVAVHQACQSLRSGETEVALVGGVNLISSPEATIALCKLKALSPDGRCKTFDASADGYGRGEGCGMVVLKRLSDAQAAGDRIYAVIRGSAVNHDGRSNGLTAPNGLAQEAVIRAALSVAKLDPMDVDYVEAHGTGTLLGDPVEVLALSRVYGERRSADAPLHLGTVKANFGHLEGAAGIAGLIKVALCLEHGRLVPQLNLHTPNPKIPWSRLAIRVPTQSLDWPPSGGRARIAGVSSFGLSGTNAHVLLEQAPAPAQRPSARVRSAELIVLSSRSQAALAAGAARLREHVRVHSELELGDLAFSLVSARSLLSERLAFMAASREALLVTLEAIERGETPAGATRASASSQYGSLAWLFTGQGAQELGMGQALYAEWSAFRQALDAAFSAINPHLPQPLEHIMWASPGSSQATLLDHTAYTQPALFALQWALAALWRSWGVEPDLLLGHSIGELSAACVAGVFSLEDAARLVCARGRLMQALPAGGAMVSIAASELDVSSAVSRFASSVTVAAINGPSSTVVSGATADVLSVAQGFSARGVQTRRLTVSHAFHSPLMEPMLADFAAVARSVTYHAPTLRIVSNLSGELAADELTSPDYWVRHVREAVRFSRGVQALQAVGATTFVEIGPKSTLLALAHACLSAEVTLLPSLRSGRPEPHSMLEALAAWVARGGSFDPDQLFPSGARRVPLPNYPWQRRRFWIEPVVSTPGVRDTRTEHPLLGARIASASADAVYESLLSTTEPAWLSDHRLGAQLVVPATVFVELICAAIEDYRDGAPIQLENLVLLNPLRLDERSRHRIQVALSENGSNASVYSQSADASPGSSWEIHASAKLDQRALSPPLALDLAALRRRCSEAVDVSRLYASLAALGFEYGPAFHGLSAIWRGQKEVLCELSLPDVTQANAYSLHPVLLQAAIQGVASLLPSAEHGFLLPSELGRLLIRQRRATKSVAHVRLAAGASADECVVDITLADDSGALVAEISSLRLRVVDRAVFGQPSNSALPSSFYRIDWKSIDSPASAEPSGRWLIVPLGAEGSGNALAAALSARALECSVASLPELRRGRSLAANIDTEHVICLWGSIASDAGAAIQAAQRGLAVVQALAGRSPAPRLWWVTQNALSVGAREGVAPGSATVWGLGRTLMLEHPELRVMLIDVDARASLPDILLSELSAAGAEMQVAWRGSQRFVARLAPAVMPRAEGVAAFSRTEQTVLITGGLGALGLEVARHLAERGTKHLLLTGRRGIDTPGAARVVSELQALGAKVTVAAVDAADRGALARLLASLPPQLPLRGVIHAAGLVDDGLLVSQTEARFAAVLAPKVSGAINLDELTRDIPLDFFVLFSSIAASFGSAAQGAYSAANAFLDAIAAHRHALGLPAVSLAWGPWSERGMAAALDDKQQARFARQGLAMLSSSQALALFDAALGVAEPHLIIVPINRRAAAAAFGSSIPPLWSSLLPDTAAAASAPAAWVRELAALPPEQRLRTVADVVRRDVARVLSLAGAEAVPSDLPLRELGLDSLMAVELRNSLARRAGVALSATVVFDHPTPDAISKYLMDQLQLSEAATPIASVVPTVAVDEPIAIVGIGCRFPGGITDPGSFWSLLENAVDAVCEVPLERWNADALYDPDPDAPGKVSTRYGGFLRDVDQFDAAFFGISPREAAKMDPQQRLLLETSWEALERAQLRPEALMGSNTGVFVGLSYQEYASFVGGLGGLDGYVMTGNAASVASGRLSYVLGLQGPSMTVDTACSSSLVTLHLACQALRRGECTLALAGGVALMLTPAAFVEFSRLRGLARDGRCKTFSADADGTGWSEGCGMLMLERLSDAQRNGHPIAAIVRATAVNQDGRSNGLTAPNGPSQQAVILEALRRGGVAPADVGFVECHGTGTALGDPIEVQALGAVFANSRTPDDPVILGALKSNLGHTQAAAGVAGVIKAVLALQHGRIPKNLHYTAPNPHIPWGALPVRVASEVVDWPRNGKPRIAGVSAFGISGTNAHALLEEAPPQPQPAAAPTRAAELVVLSGKTAAALDAAAARLRQHLSAQPTVSLGDIAYSLLTSRSHMDQRLALVARSVESLSQLLDAVQRGETPAGATRASASARRGALAWLFTGQGAQELGMGRGLYAEWPAFRQALDAAFAAVDPLLPEPLHDVMWAPQGTPRAALLDHTGYTQPALFAFQWALAALWRSWGVVPDLLLGHSIGEISAACVAGVFSLQDGARLVCARARLMQALPSGGAMVSIAAPEFDVASAVSRFASTVSVAAMNGPSSIVISGVAADVISIAQAFSARGIQTKRLTVSHAFHSPLMLPMLADFAEVARSITYHSPTLRLVSNLTGELAKAELTSADYWVRHVQEAVRFSRGVQSLSAAGAATFIEVGPKSTLLGLASASLPADATLLPSLRSSRPEPDSILEALGAWVARGGSFDPDRLFPSGARRVPLPTYSWQRRRFWIEPAASTLRTGGTRTEHPLLGARIATASADAVYESLLSTTEPAWLADHRLGAQAVVPATALVELICAAAEHYAQGVAIQLNTLILRAPLLLPSQGPQHLQVVLTEAGAKAAVYSQSAEFTANAPWTLCASAELSDAPYAMPKRLDLDALRLRCTATLDIAEVYRAFAALGLNYGRTFQGLRGLKLGQGEALAELALDEATPSEPYLLHPALLDAALQAAAALMSSESALVPFELGRTVVYQRGANRAVAHLRRAEGTTSAEAVLDIRLADATGALIAEVESLRLRRVDPAALTQPAVQSLPNAFYRLDWQEVATPAAGASPARCLIVSVAASADAAALAGFLAARGLVVEVASLQDLRSNSRKLAGQHVVCLWGRTDPDAGSAIDVASEGLAVVQALASNGTAPHLWWVTQSAVAVSPGADVVASSATLWGLGRSIMVEHPELRLTLIDLEPQAAYADILFAELCGASDESQLAWRGARRLAARVVPASPVSNLKHSASEIRPFEPTHTVLITGGLGALGLRLARHLVDRGVRHLVLAGRRGLDTPGAFEAISSMQELGAEVSVSAVDITDRRALAQLLQEIPARFPLRGVVHAAGAIDDALLAEQTAERFSRVLAPKVAGALNLHELTLGVPLEFFVLFSSIAGSFGSASQGAYAAANAFLDALATHRRVQGLPALSLAWGPWSERGMAAALDVKLQARFARQGLPMLSPPHGMQLFDAALLRSEASLLVVPIDRRAAAQAFGSLVPPLWRALLRPPASHSPATDDWARQLAGLTSEQSLQTIVRLVRHEVANILSLPSASEVRADQPLQELGLDSLLAVELRTALMRQTSAALPASLAFDNPTPQAIAEHLMKLLRPSHPASPGSVQNGKPTKATPRAAEIHSNQLARGECIARVRNPKLRLFCFHHAGGDASIFASFTALAASGIEVHTVSIVRDDPTLADGPRYVEQAAAYIASLSDRPTALFGHSLGALLALRVIGHLEREGRALPVLYLPSAPPLRLRGDEPQVAFQKIFGERSSELQNMFATFSMDVRLWQSLPEVEQPIDVPIAALLGANDPLVSEEDLRKLAEITSRDFSLTVLPGDHFYLLQQATQPLLLARLAERLASACELPSAAGASR